MRSLMLTLMIVALLCIGSCCQAQIVAWQPVALQPVVVPLQPVTVATSRWRPFLGGVVTRYHTAWTPVMAVQPQPAK